MSEDEEFGRDLAQAVLVSHLDLIGAVLDFLGVPHENGFFAKDMDPKPYFTEGLGRPRLRKVSRQDFRSRWCSFISITCDGNCWAQPMSIDPLRPAGLSSARGVHVLDISQSNTDRSSGTTLIQNECCKPAARVWVPRLSGFYAPGDSDARYTPSAGVRN